MKKWLLLLLVAAVIQSAGAAVDNKFIDPLDQPAVLHPKASTKGVLMAAGLAGKRIVALGGHGIVLYSDDQGRSWVQATVPLESALVALSFTSPLKGWASGHDGAVIFTGDGGKSWTKRLDGRSTAKLILAHYQGELEKHPDDAVLAEAVNHAQRLVEEGPDKVFLDVWFQDELNGYLVGSFGLILATADGGKNWVPWMDRTDNPDGYHLHSIRGAGSEVFIAGEHGLILRLDREKNRFSALPLPSQGKVLGISADQLGDQTGRTRLDTEGIAALAEPYHGTMFGVLVRDSEVTVFGLGGRVFISRDNGKNWDLIPTDSTSNINGGAYLPDGRIVLVTEDEHILLSQNNKTRFTHSSCGMPCYSVAAIDASHLVVAGKRGVRVLPIPQSSPAR